jgi:S1-C subfamily serine protease
LPGRPRQEGVVRHIWPLILAAALLSASLSAIGTYAAISLTPKPPPAASAATGQSGAAQAVTMTRSEAIVRVAAQVKPSVVTILAAGVSGVTPFSMPVRGAGSGFIVSADGLILTNNHVVHGASSLTVVFDDTHVLPAVVVATDPQHDLALVKVNATGLTPVTTGDSGGVKVGQLVIAIGSPLGTFTDSVTQGIVSGVDRRIVVDDQAARSPEILSGLIQTDAAINPGNSGGPLLDATGSVVGIIVANATNAQEVGFAIPMNQASAMIASATR